MTLATDAKCGSVEERLSVLSGMAMLALLVACNHDTPSPPSAAAATASTSDLAPDATEPAAAVDGFPVPVIATRVLGGMHGMQARTPAAVELTVVSGSIETTRGLFPKALTRLLAIGAA